MTSTPSSAAGPERTEALSGSEAAGGDAPDLTALRRASGVFSRPLQRIAVALLEGPVTLPDLVRRTGVPRRMVEDVLDALSGDLVPGDLVRRPSGGGGSSGGERTYALPRAHRERYLRELALPDLVTRATDDIVGSRLAGDRSVRQALRYLESLEPLRPAPDRNLDHVAADPVTLVRRALWLDAAYDLPGACAEARGLLCVGDHDLTSLAVAAVVPGVRVAVMDLDDRVLETVDTQARAHGWDVTCVWGDVRNGLPAPLHAAAAVAFTDPPYTPEGVAAFLVAAAQGLADRERGRVLMAYGYGEHQPALGLKVQQAVLDVHLAVEAILPGFNTYAGAQAIGSRSDLYVLQPTARTWRALPALAERAGTRLYTHGNRSLESGGNAPPAAAGVTAGRVDRGAAPALRAALDLAAGQAAEARMLLAGERWPDLPVDGPGRPAQRARVGTLLAKGLPQQLGRGTGVTVLADLLDAPAPWLLRLLLAVTADRVVVALPPGGAGAVEADLLLVQGKYETAVRPGAVADVLDARRAAAPTVAADVLGHAHGKLANVWREALVARALRAGTTLTKNEARSLVAQALAGLPDVGDLRLVDAPRHVVEAVVDRLGR